MENCDRFEPMFDLIVDDALTDAECARLEAHCAACPACAEKRRASEALKRMLSELPPEEDVPLKVQAAWRGAVKAEAGRVRRRALTRWAGGIAAALVLALGGMFALRNNAPQAMLDAPMADAGRSVAVIEADGQSAARSMAAPEAMEYAAEDDEAEACEEAPAEAAAPLMAAGVAPFTEEAAPIANGAATLYQRRMTVEDLERTCAYIADLAAEYEGSLEDRRYEEGGAACASLSIDLPAENAADFLSAAAPYDPGAGLGDDLPAAEGGRVSILLILTETTEVQEK